MKASRSIACLGAALPLIACSGAVEPSNGSGPSPSSPESGEAAPEGAAALSGVYVARERASASPGTTGGAPVGMKALFHGRFEVRDNCLVFSGGGQVYLPLLSAATPVSVFPTRVEIGGRPHPFDRDTVITGGAIGGTGADLLQRNPPASCSSYPLLRVSGISAAS